MIRTIQNIAVVLLLGLSLFSCQKELLEEATIRYEAEPIANLVTTASEISHNASEAACNPFGISKTTFALFYNTQVDANVELSSADYLIYSPNGIAYFSDIEPGNYFVVAKNEKGVRVNSKQVKFGTNEITLEF